MPQVGGSSIGLGRGWQSGAATAISTEYSTGFFGCLFLVMIRSVRGPRRGGDPQLPSRPDCHRTGPGGLARPPNHPSRDRAFSWRCAGRGGKGLPRWRSFQCGGYGFLYWRSSRLPCWRGAGLRHSRFYHCHRRLQGGRRPAGAPLDAQPPRDPAHLAAAEAQRSTYLTLTLRFVRPDVFTNSTIRSIHVHFCSLLLEGAGSGYFRSRCVSPAEPQTSGLV